MRTRVTEQLGIRLPLVQAPMGGGPGTVALAAAASEAGALGSLAAGYLSADELRAELRALRAVTSRPFAVNVFVAEPSPADPALISVTQDVLEPYRMELGLPARSEDPAVRDAFDAQMEVLLAEPAPVVSFTFGLPPPDVVVRLHEAGSTLVGTATTVREARAVADAGLDLVCVQGAEAGAHRGTFLDEPSQAVIGTLALVPQVCDAVAVPVIAAGGVMDGRGVAAVLALGAGAAQMGTAFLRCPEAGTPAPHRRALAAASDTSTALTSKITGRLARGIRNPLMVALEAHDVPPYPVMNALTSELRRQAADLDRPDLMSLWAGQGAPLGMDIPAGELIGRVHERAVEVIRELASP